MGQFFISQFNGEEMDVEVMSILSYGVMVRVNADVSLMELVLVSGE